LWKGNEEEDNKKKEKKKSKWGVLGGVKSVTEEGKWKGKEEE
jgi:hypothetical protein